MAECLVSRVGSSGIDLSIIDAIAGDILSGKVIVDKNGNPLTGTMTNNGAWNGSVARNSSVTIPAGYHSGSGTVTGPSMTDYTGSTTRKTFTPSSSSQTYLIPQGYHDGQGQVVCNAMSFPASATLLNSGSGGGGVPANQSWSVTRSGTISAEYKYCLMFAIAGTPGHDSSHYGSAGSSCSCGGTPIINTTYGVSAFNYNGGHARIGLFYTGGVNRSYSITATINGGSYHSGYPEYYATSAVYVYGIK